MLEFKKNQKGVLVILGGFFVHLVLGSFYLWGVINVYVTSYYRLHSDSTLELKTTSALFCFMLLATSLSFFFSLSTIKRFNPRIIVTLEMLFISVSVFISSFMSNFWMFMIFYGIIFGFFAGFIYIVPIFLSCQYFPDKKGIISGVITGGYGIATIFSSLIFQYIVNPENKKAQIVYGGDKYFDHDVADNLPKAIRFLSLYYLIVGGIGGILMMKLESRYQQPYDQENKENDETSDRKLINTSNSLEENGSKLLKFYYLNSFLI